MEFDKHERLYKHDIKYYLVITKKISIELSIKHEKMLNNEPISFKTYITT